MAKLLFRMCAFAAFLFLLGSTPAHAEDEPRLVVHRDLTYARVGDEELKLDLFVPANPKPALVVWIHGGGWRGGSRRNPRLAKLADEGYALASISYRFTNKAVFPAQVHDCKAAIRWLRAHGKKYGYESKWIAVAGSSAGGHLALMLGVSGGVDKLEGELGEHREQSSRVQAVIDYFGPADFVLRGQTQPERAYTQKSGSFALMGGKDGKRLSEQVERFASPVTYLTPDDPPLLIFHGDSDKTVLLDQSQRLEKVAKAKKMSAQLVVLEGAGHGGQRFFTGKHFETAVKFLKSCQP